MIGHGRNVRRTQCLHPGLPGPTLMKKQLGRCTAVQSTILHTEFCRPWCRLLAYYLAAGAEAATLLPGSLTTDEARPTHIVQDLETMHHRTAPGHCDNLANVKCMTFSILYIAHHTHTSHIFCRFALHIIPYAGHP